MLLNGSVNSKILKATGIITQTHSLFGAKVLDLPFLGTSGSHQRCLGLPGWLLTTSARREPKAPPFYCLSLKRRVRCGLIKGLAPGSLWREGAGESFQRTRKRLSREEPPLSHHFSELLRSSSWVGDKSQELWAPLGWSRCPLPVPLLSLLRKAPTSCFQGTLVAPPPVPAFL